MKNTMTIELDPETMSIKFSKTVTYEGDQRVHSVYMPGPDPELFTKLSEINKDLNDGIRRFENAQR